MTTMVAGSTPARWPRTGEQARSDSAEVGAGVPRGQPVPATHTLYDHCAAWAERRTSDGTPFVWVGAARAPMTRSGDALLVTLAEDDVAALQPGDVVIVWLMRGTAPVVVRRVRTGVAYDKYEKPFEVPIVEAEPAGVWAVGEILAVQLLEAA